MILPDTFTGLNKIIVAYLFHMLLPPIRWIYSIRMRDDLNTSVKYITLWWGMISKHPLNRLHCNEGWSQNIDIWQYTKPMLFVLRLSLLLHEIFNYVKLCAHSAISYCAATISHSPIAAPLTAYHHCHNWIINSKWTVMEWYRGLVGWATSLLLRTCYVIATLHLINVT